MMTLLQSALTGWTDYTQHGKFAALLLLAILYLGFVLYGSGKEANASGAEKARKRLYLYGALVTFGCICPVTALILLKYQTAFYSYVFTRFGRPIHALQTDNGKEFDNIAVRNILTTHGTIFRLTCPYTSQQNGRAERILRTLNDCVRTLLFHANVPPRFWPDALATASLLINIRLCRPRWNYAPHHLLFGAPPSYDGLRIFGCLLS